MSILTVENLAKNYGRIRALNGVSFDVPKGTVFGILGPNGSGKTTLLGTVTDIIRPTSGTYKLFDGPATAEKRKRVGTLLETPNFYHYLSAVQNLTITSEVKQRGKNDIKNVLEMVHLSHRKHSRFSTYSLGMKQRLAIAGAMLGDPEVLIFDEPTNGLDPVGIAEIRDLMKELSKRGKTIIMASHMLDEVEKVCNHVAILKNGNLLASGSVGEILVQEDIVEVSASDLVKLNEVLQNVSGISKAEPGDGLVRAFFPVGIANLAELNEYCHSRGVILNHLILKKKSLESKFLELTNNN